MFSSKHLKTETSLVVQWLRLWAPNAEVEVQPLVWELDPTRLNEEFDAATKDPTCHNYHPMQSNKVQ